MKFARLIAVWLLMLTLPLQAMAAYAPVQRCSDDHAASIQQAHDSHTEHQAMSAAADHGDQSHVEGPCCDTTGHGCCHNVFTGAAAATAPQAPQAPRTITPRVSLLNTLFIPDLPQRPPRA